MQVPMSLLILIAEYSDFKWGIIYSKVWFWRGQKSLKLISQLFMDTQMSVTPTKLQFGSYQNFWNSICQNTTLIMGIIRVY